jgi:hypothetical protein
MAGVEAIGRKTRLVYAVQESDGRMITRLDQVTGGLSRELFVRDDRHGNDHAKEYPT